MNKCFSMKSQLVQSFVFRHILVCVRIALIAGKYCLSIFNEVPSFIHGFEVFAWRLQRLDSSRQTSTPFSPAAWEAGEEAPA